MKPLSRKMCRRSFALSGAAAAGLSSLMGWSVQAEGKKASDMPFLTPWSPPAERERDLTPGTTPVRLAARTRETDLIYPADMSITEMVRRIRERGYTSTTARYGVGTRNPWLDCPESDVDELKTALEEYDVTFFGFRAANNIIHPDSAERKKIHRWLIEQCEASERLGAPSVTTATGSCDPRGANIMHPDTWTWETWKRTVKIFRQILGETAGMKVALGIEAINMSNINSPRSHLQLIEDVGDPRCKVTIDPVNMINLGTYFRTTEIINESFDLLGENIIVADAKDSYLLPDTMSAYMTQVIPGRGVIDYETYLVRLSRMKYPRPLLLEGLQEQEYPEAKTFIETTAKRVGVTLYQ